MVFQMKAEEETMSPKRQGRELVNELYPVWYYINRLTMTNKGNNRVKRSGVSLIVSAWSRRGGGAGIELCRFQIEFRKIMRYT